MGDIEEEQSFFDYENVTPDKEEEEVKALSTMLKPKTEKKSRMQAVPKTTKQFFKARSKDPKKFTFTQDGNLQIPAMNNQPESVLELPYYNPPTIDEIRESEEKRKEILAGIESIYDAKLQDLRTALFDWRTSGIGSGVVLKIQEELRTLDAQRRPPITWTKLYPNPITRDILFENRYEVRKIGFPCFAMVRRSLPDEVQYKESSAPIPKEVEEDESEGEGEDEGKVETEQEAILLFYDATDPAVGSLSPFTMLSVVIGGTKYNSIMQAYEGERLVALGRKDIRDLVLLKRTNPVQIRAAARKVVGEVEDPVALWIRVLENVVKQNAPIAEVLRSTGSSILAFADPLDQKGGIGLPKEDEKAMNKKEWTGENQIGKAWMAVRNRVSTSGELESMEGGAVEIEARTLESAKQERKRYFIGLHKSGFRNKH